MLPHTSRKRQNPLANRGWLDLLSEYDILMQHHLRRVHGNKDVDDLVSAMESQIVNNVKGKPLGLPKDQLLAL